MLDEGLYEDGGINYFDQYNHSETCVTGIVLSILAYFQLDDSRIKSLVTHLLKQQMPDGGWNCLSYKGATHSSFHTTINVLEGLKEYQFNFEPNNKRISKSINQGIEFLLVHKLFRSHRTGNIADSKMTRFSFPTGWTVFSFAGGMGPVPFRVEVRGAPGKWVEINPTSWFLRPAGPFFGGSESAY